jgi:hypothetical protein
MTMDMAIFGGGSSDHIQVVPSSGVTVCGFTIGPPLYNSHRIHIFGGTGVDYLIAGTGLGDMWAELGDDSFETDANQLITYNPSASLTGAEGNDQLINRATPSNAFFFGQGGYDIILTPKRGTVTMVACGAGGAAYCGPPPSFIDSCTPDTRCNGW